MEPQEGVSKMSILEALIMVTLGISLPTWDVGSDIALSYSLIFAKCMTFENYVSEYYDGSLAPVNHTIDKFCNYDNRGNRSGFKCESSGSCIKRIWVCDAENDCDDGSDEDPSISDCTIYSQYGPYIMNNSYCETSRDYSGSHPKFGLAILTPVLISTMFVFIHWWRTEANLITLPLVFCQCWPQYRIIRILYFGLIKHNIRWKTENEEQKKDVCSLEPFLEAVPQIHILLVLWVLNSKINYQQNRGLFIATFITSVLSATLGIAKFLKIGPCRLVPDQGPLSGHGTLSFLILMLNIKFTLISKGIMLPAIGYGIYYGEPFEALTRQPSTMIGVWLSICYLPQFIYCTIVLLTSLGPKHFFKIILQYPAFILTPVFSYWTFGSHPEDCCKRGNENNLKISFRLTWRNVAITTLGNLSLFLIHFFSKDLPNSKFFSATQPNILLHIISAMCLVLSWITLIILQNLQECQMYCCSCCQSDQVFQKTGLDPNNPDELIDLMEWKIHETQDNKLIPSNGENELSHSILEDVRTLSMKMKNVASGSVFVSEEPKQSSLILK